MTTQRDLEVAAEAGLPRDDIRICDKCGWYALVLHAETCDPTRGRKAQQLIDAVPDVRSGQLGYGNDQVVFEPADNIVVRFQVNRAGARGRAFSLRDVYCLGSLTAGEAADLVHAIKAWADTVAARRKSL